MLRKNQNGFSPLLILLIVVVIGAIGFGAYYVMNNREEDASTNQISQTEETSGTQPAADPSEDGKYLVIKEWGVKFELPSNLSDTKYNVSESGSSVTLSTASLEKYPGCESGNVISLQRAKDGEPIGSSDVNSIRAANPAALTQVGDYYYLFNAAQFSCTQDPSGRSYLSETITDLSQAVKTLQSI